VTGLRAMVDEIARVPGVLRAMVAVPSGDDGRVRFLAHVGKRGFGAHAPIEQVASPMVAKALHSGELVQLFRSEGDSPHACVNVPIRGTTELLGVLGVGASVPVPLEPWREEFIRSIADLMALLLLRLAGNADLSPQSGQPLARLTRRQRQVLLALADDGASNAAIGRRLGLSALTVKAHLQVVFRQLGVNRRADAIRILLTHHAEWLARERDLLPPRSTSK
jgi:LuxR family transcriptional regulator, positive regulator of biofilm formation